MKSQMKARLFLLVLFFSFVMVIFGHSKAADDFLRIENVSMISHSSGCDCKDPKIIEMGNETWIFWIQENKSVCYSNESGKGVVITLFEVEGLSSHDFVIYDGKIIAVISYFNENVFGILLKFYDLETRTWSNEMMQYSDNYEMKISSPILSLLIDNVTGDLYLTWTYIRSIIGSERLCLSKWNGACFTEVQTISETMFRYHGQHPNQGIFNERLYYAVNVYNNSEFHDYLVEWSKSFGERILEIRGSHELTVQFLTWNGSFYISKVASNFFELDIIRESELHPIFNNSGTLISKTFTDVSINSSGFIHVGYSKSIMGEREVYVSLFSFNGTLILTNCISRPLKSHRESIITVMQNLMVSSQDNGLIVWVDRTDLTGEYCYNVFVSSENPTNNQDTLEQFLDILDAWWILPVIIAGGVLYLYFKYKK